MPLSTVTIKSNPESMFKSTTTVYKVGQKVNISCNSYSYYTFEGWTDQTGAVLSSSRSFTYTVPEGDPVLTANYKFTPGSPAEPTETKPKHKVFFTANPAGAGSFSQSSGMQVSEGSNFSITASARESYVFVNWTDASGLEVGTNDTYRSTMGTEDVTLVANFRFSPGNPSDPGQSNKERYTLYLPTVQMYQGETTMLPVYLENTGNVAEVSFAIQLPDHVRALTDGLMTTSRTSAYTPTASQSGNTLTVSVAGGSQISGDNGVLLYIPLTTESGCVDGEYPVTFASASAVLADGMAKTVTTRNGTLEIVTLEEGELQAQFSVDRYLNRVQLTNMSSATARTFVWDFGDGTTSTEASPMHVYTTPGTYTIRLTAKAIVKTSTAEQVIVVNAPSTWTASGDYTLNPDIEGIRNFTSIPEMMDIFSQCRIDGNITVDYQGTRMAHGVYADSELDQIGTIAAALKAGDYTMTLKSTGEVRSITIGVKADEDYYRTVMGWLENVPTVDVNIFLNYVGINTLALRAAREQTIYSGETTQAVALTAMTTGADVSWASVVGAYCPISGRLYDGTGDIPAMTLTLEGKTAASIDYEIVYTLDGLALYTMTYRFTVLPAIEYVDADDLAALRLLYNTLGGDGWTKKWDITSDVIEAGNWQGVTFDDDGCVTAIALSNNRLSGTVPATGFILPRLKTLNLSKNNLSGDLAAFTSRLIALESLNMSYCLFESLDAPLPIGISSLDLGYQLNNRALSSFDLQDWAMSGAIDNVALTSIMTYDHKAQSWTAHPRLKVYSSGSVVAYLDYFESIGAYGITLTGNYNIESGAEFEVRVADGIAEGCRLRASLSWERGDANADGGVDVADAQQTLNHILGRLKGNFNYAAANTYADDIINIQDIVSTVNIFIDSSPATGASYAAGKAGLPTCGSLLYNTGESLVLASDTEIGALDITLGGVSASQVSLALNRGRYQMIARDTADGARVVVISPTGDAIPSANNPVLNVYGECTVLSVSAVDIDANHISIGTAAPDGIESVTADPAAEKAYDLLGRPTTPDSKGLKITKGKKILR